MSNPIGPIAMGAIMFAAAAAWAGALSPEASRKQIELEPGFAIELFAAEPDIVDPVAITFDERGRMFVAEMREMEVLPATTPGARATIRMLEDLDGDGDADRSTVFADGLSFPSGLAPFDGGLYAICTPDLLYLKDTDGDGVADTRRTVLTGFAQGNAEHRVNNLKWGIDNGLYAANGSGGGDIHDPRDPISDATISLAGRDLRLDPWTGCFEAISRQMPGGFGLSFDDWGRRFVCQNEYHAIHIVLPERYLARNPDLVIRTMGEDITHDGQIDDRVYPISPPEPWRAQRTARRARKTTNRMRETQLQVKGYFSAACGVAIYRAALFPEPYRGSLFVCDAGQNLVHRALLTERGATMHAERADENREFLRSADTWFRPVNLSVGPDGALYVVDFYREIIETAASIPEDILAELDLRAGADRGRIWRITPQGHGAVRTSIALADQSSEQLTEALGHPNAWHRQTAQRLLIERKAVRITPLLKKIAGENPNPLARLHALWTLDGLGTLDEKTIRLALQDGHPRIREHAIRLAETLLASDR